MRPLPYGSGKVRPHGVICDQSHASMRPLPYGSGKVLDGVRYGGRGGRFNEAAPLRKRKGGEAEGQERGGKASMRPLPYGSGKAHWAGLLLYPLRASMRPLPYGSGKRMKCFQCSKTIESLQ